MVFPLPLDLQPPREALVSVRLRICHPNHCIAPQLPTQRPIESTTPITRGLSQPHSSIPRSRPIAFSVAASVIRRSSLTVRLKFSPSLRSSLPVTLSISCRSLSSFSRSRADKPAALEVCFIDRPLQAPPGPALRVPRGDVVLPLAGHLQARLPQCRHHAGAVPDGLALDPLNQVVPDQLPGLGLDVPALRVTELPPLPPGAPAGSPAPAPDRPAGSTHARS